MILRQVLDKPIYGWWDGGAKSVFDWSIDSIKSRHPGRVADNVAVVGSWQANHWFEVKAGKTEKETLGKARARLTRAINKRNFERPDDQIHCTFTYVEERD